MYDIGPRGKIVAENRFKSSRLSDLTPRNRRRLIRAGKLDDLKSPSIEYMRLPLKITFMDFMTTDQEILESLKAQVSNMTVGIHKG